jgi:hypothetical protein
VEGCAIAERFRSDSAPSNFTTEITETALRTRKGVGERIPFGRLNRFCVAVGVSEFSVVKTKTRKERR